MIVAGFVTRSTTNIHQVLVGALMPSGALVRCFSRVGTNSWDLASRAETSVESADALHGALMTLASAYQGDLMSNPRQTVLPLGVYDIGEPSDDSEKAVIDALWMRALSLGMTDEGEQESVRVAVERMTNEWQAQIEHSTNVSELSHETQRISEADAEVGVLDDAGPFIRPNGLEYKPRVVSGRHQDVALLRRLHAQKMPVRLYGPAGSGKTAVVEAAFPEVITVLGNGDLTVSGLVGGLVPDGASWRWVDGPLTRAMKEGKPLFVDEILRIPNEVLAILLAATDGRGILRLDDNPESEVVEAAEGFGVIAAYNPDITGGRHLDEAILSRFVVGIEITTDYEVALELGVPEKAVLAARNLHTRNASSMSDGGFGNWVPQMRELLAFRDFMAMGLGEEFSVGALLSACPVPEDLPVVVETISRVFGFTPSLLSAGGRA